MTSTPHNPDDRDLLDFADAVAAGENPQPHTDLERTFLHVQNAMQGESGAIPADLKQSTWEDVMSTLAITPEAPVSNRTRRQRQLTAPKITLKRFRWTPMASIAAAVLVVLASVGIWTAAIYESPTPPPAPRQVAGLAPGELFQLATPSPKYACDFSKDMPILEAENGIPTEGTTLVWEKGGDLYVHCDAAPEGILLASDVNDVAPVEGIAGLIQYSPVSETESSVSVFLNITNGLSYDTGDWMVNPGFVQQSWADYQNGKYLFVNDIEHKLVALNTDTMVALVIEEIFGSGAPDSFNLISATSADESTLAIALMPQGTEELSDPPALRGTEIGAPGDVLIMDMDSGETTWVTLPGDDVRLKSLNVSPDGSKIAAELKRGEGDMNSDVSVQVISVSDGTVLAESGTFEALMSASVWTDTGLVVQAGNELLQLPFDGSTPTALYTLPKSNTALQGLQSTHDPNIVTVNATICKGECRVSEADNSVISIDVATGELKEFEGVNLAYVTWEDKANLLLMTDPSVTLPDPTTYTAIDPVSGETIAVFEDMPGTGYVENQRPTIGPQSISTTPNGEQTIVAVTLKDMIELKSDGTEHSARLLPAPGRWADEGAGNQRAAVFLSPDGTMLSAMATDDESNGRFILDLIDPNAEWSGAGSLDNLPSGNGYIRFVEGVPED